MILWLSMEAIKRVKNVECDPVRSVIKSEDLNSLPKFVLIEREARRHKMEHLDGSGRRNQELLKCTMRLRAPIEAYCGRKFETLLKGQSFRSTRCCEACTVPPIIGQLLRLPSHLIYPVVRIGTSNCYRINPEPEVKNFLKLILNLPEVYSGTYNTVAEANDHSVQFLEDNESKLLSSAGDHIDENVLLPLIAKLKIVMKTDDRDLFQIIESWKSHVKNSNSSMKFIYHCKHLCGSGTDILLEKAMRHQIACPDTKIKIAAAPCCHHKINLSTYLGADYLERALYKFHKTRGHDAQLLTTESVFFGAGWGTGSSIDAQMELGRRLKRILDGFRIKSLRDKGFKTATLTIYTDKAVTVENTMIIV